ncbi:hypothetical protein [Thiosocius teredinicola]|uniref:hypothetical protein n=1 Tax=Thiosocius teredinicola TaxID=1973002 RepID=UPI000F7AE89B
MAQWFHVTCEAESDNLFQLADGRYQFTAHGRTAPLMIGYGYVLADRALAKYLVSRRLQEIEIRPATLYRRTTNEEFDTHAEICIGSEIEFEKFDEVQAHGEQLAIMGKQYLFASSALKEELERAKFEYLRFSEGLSEFCAGT